MSHTNTSLPPLQRAGTFKTSQQQQQHQQQLSSQSNKDIILQQQIYDVLNNPSFPSQQLQYIQPWRYYIYILCILSMYCISDTFIGIEIGILDISGHNRELFILIAWLLHFAGIVLLFICMLILMFKRTVYSNSIMLCTYITNICCIGASIMFTSRLNINNLIHTTDNNIRNNDIGVILQWFGCIMLYVLHSYITYHSVDRHSVYDINQYDIDTHKLLLEIKKLAIDNNTLDQQIIQYKQQLLQQEQEKQDTYTQEQMLLNDSIDTKGGSYTQTGVQSLNDSQQQFNNVVAG